jgi:hypothetical protein
VRRRDHESITIKDRSGDIEGLSGALCADVVARNAVASGMGEAPNSGGPPDDTWELTRTEVVKQLERARRVVGGLKNALSDPGLAGGHRKAEEHGFFAHSLLGDDG